LQFFYHPDHLGSSNYITDASGEVYQHNEYFPYGETFVEERNNTEYTTYLFSGKELDVETGLYYFHARYYDPRTSVFLNIDPMSDKYPHQSNYTYCSNNPLNVIDPDGRDEWEINTKGKVTWKEKSDTHTLHAVGSDGKRTGASLTLKDRTIFDNLAKTGKDSNYTASFSVGDKNSKEDMLKVFKFAADNTPNAEWRIDKFRTDNGGIGYSVGTAHMMKAITSEQMGYKTSSVIAFIHSHPGAGKDWELGSMGFNHIKNDKMNYTKNSDVDYKMNVAAYKNPLYYTYFPISGNLWLVRDRDKPAFIRKVSSSAGFPF